jgi:uncharacterized protein (TIGR02996 family)
MDLEEALLQAIRDQPADDASWLVLSDYLEEQGQPDRAELVRLTLRLRRADRARGRNAREKRLGELLAAGVRPCVPTLTNSIGMQFALIPPGTFLMGSPRREKGRYREEGPRHEVEITQPFYLGAHTVTQEQYERVTGTNPSSFAATGDIKRKVAGLDTRHFPVDSVLWDQAVAFCAALARLPGERRRGRTYRLATEAEWEYACRAGTTTPFHFGPSLGSAQANFEASSPYGDAAAGTCLGHPVPVGSYPPNAWGVYDMHGNVWEWVADWHSPDYYRHSPRQDPQGPAEGEHHFLRGGSWGAFGVNCRAAFRYYFQPGHAGIGFRVVLAWRG